VFGKYKRTRSYGRSSGNEFANAKIMSGAGKTGANLNVGDLLSLQGGESTLAVGRRVTHVD